METMKCEHMKTHGGRTLYDAYFDKKSEKMMHKMIKDRNIRPSTGQGYLTTVKLYALFNKKQIYELIEEALEEQDAHIPLRESKLKKRLLAYREYLSDDFGGRATTIKTYFSKILTVYRHFECEIPVLPLMQYNYEYVSTYEDLPTLAHLREALDITTVRLRAVICFQASSGSAKAETLSLSVRQFFQGVQEYHDITFSEDYDTLTKILHTLGEKLKNYDLIVPRFYLERIKTKKYYYTFCSPEATYWIIRDLKSRLYHDEDISKFLDEKLFDFSSSALSVHYQDINDYFDWGFKGPYRFFRSHVLRKWNASNIQMTTEDIDNIQGRSKDVVHEAYIKVRPERLKKTYMEHMWRVCISREWREACIVLDPISKEELGLDTPDERAIDKLMSTIEESLGDKFNITSPLNKESIVEAQSNRSVNEAKLTGLLNKLDNLEGSIETVPNETVPSLHQNPAPVAQQSPTSSDVGAVNYDKLLQYAPLLQQGLITQDEFNQIKADIFNGGV